MGAAASISAKMLVSGKGIRYLGDGFAPEWLCGLSSDGVATLIIVAIIPSLLVLNRVRAATDTMRLLDFVEQFRYFAVAGVLGAFLLLGDDALRRMQVPIVVDARYGILGTAIGGFSFLMSVMVMVVDVWCRVPRNARQSRVGRKNPVSRFCRLVLMLAPVVLVGVAAFLRVRHAM